MAKYTKSTKLANVNYEVRGPVLKEADRMIAGGETVLKLNIGNPAVFGFSAPDALLEELSTHVRASQAYSDSKGIAPARAAIAAYCKSKGFSVEEAHIYTGNGASEMISIAMTALLAPGDEILIPAPDYPLWTASATLAGGKVVHYLCDEASDWNPDIDDIKKKVTSRTKAIVVINPNNPTGALYDKHALESIAQVARQNGLILFADEIYDRVVLEGHTHTSIASLAGEDVLCVTFNGLSKSHIICGFRCGWMALSGDVTSAREYIEGIDTLSSMRLCANVLSQHVIPIALEDAKKGKHPSLLPGGRLYEQSAFVHRAINDIPGMSAVKPKAALYIFPKMDIRRYGIVDDQQFALDFLHQEKVLLVQGTGFNWPVPDHFRIVFLPALADLEEAIARLARFLSTYKQT